MDEEPAMDQEPTAPLLIWYHRENSQRVMIHHISLDLALQEPAFTGYLPSIVDQCVAGGYSAIFIQKLPASSPKISGEPPKSPEPVKYRVSAGTSDLWNPEVLAVQTSLKNVMNQCRPGSLGDVVSAVTNQEGMNAPDVLCLLPVVLDDRILLGEDVNPHPRRLSAGYTVLASSSHLPSIRLTWMNPNDAFVMMDYYKQHSNKVTDWDKIIALNSGQFLGQIEMRVYTEWCCRNGSGPHSLYRGEAFSGWIQDETHFALERAGYTFVDGTFRFSTLSDASEGDPESNQNNSKEPKESLSKLGATVYEEMRMRVLKAIVDRAIDFSKDCKEGLRPLSDDPKNLRASLLPYLPSISK